MVSTPENQGSSAPAFAICLPDVSDISIFPDFGFTEKMYGWELSGIKQTKSTSKFKLYLVALQGSSDNLLFWGKFRRKREHTAAYYILPSPFPTHTGASLSETLKHDFHHLAFHKRFIILDYKNERYFLKKKKNIGGSDCLLWSSEWFGCRRVV